MKHTTEIELRIGKLRELRDAAYSNKRRLTKQKNTEKAEYWQKVGDSYSNEIKSLRGW